MLRYDDRGRPVGLNWEACTDGSSRPEVWSGYRPPRPSPKKPIMNPGIGRGGVNRFSAEKDALIVRLYTEDLMPAYKISALINSTPKTVWRVLNRNNVPKRSISVAQSLRHQNEREES